VRFLVASNSRIMDTPAFPDDLVPKMLVGIKAKVGWFPYIHGICVDARGQPVTFYVSIDVSLGGPKFALIVSGQPFSDSFDKSVLCLNNGILTLGTMPKFSINYRHPHKVRIDVNSAIFVELDITYRGSPLWYSKSTNTDDMVSLTHDCFVGGYDALCRIEGRIVARKKSLCFSGYGEYGHIWLLGSFRWEDVNSRWMVFNDKRSYGAVMKAYDVKTGATIASTGRFGVENESVFTFDDFEWIDDNLQPPRHVGLKGPIRNLDQTIKARIDLRTVQSVSLFKPSIWTQHKTGGSVNGTKFDGSAWCETHKPVGTPMSQYGVFGRATKLFKVIRK
jgi:hypothetical protein